MKLKILVAILEKALKMQSREGADRPDMYLPERLLAMGLVFIIAGFTAAIALFFVFEVWLIVVAAAGIAFGITALMCWKNQSIRVISSERFEYTTFLGNTYEYRFGDITAIRQNKDSITVFVGKKKVHIESMAVLSGRLVTLLNEAINGPAAEKE